MSISAFFTEIYFKFKKIKTNNPKFLTPEGRYPYPPEFKNIKTDIMSFKTRNYFKLYSPGEKKGVILYLHGGSYELSFSRQHWLFSEKLIKATKYDLYAPDYYLIPYTYENNYEMLMSIYKEINENYGDNIILLRDSAGGGLAIGFCMYLRDHGINLPKKVITISPWLDLSLKNEDIKIYDKKDPFLNVKSLSEIQHLYAPHNSHNPYVSPIYGDFKNLPEIYIFFGTKDILYPDALKLKNLNIKNINFFIIPDMLHNYIFLPVKEAKISFGKITDIISDK
ncbi:MAG TPA: alpha/beta hydrolase [Tepiditoga sp.]|nr:alpha/beta hydrolase [Tepiditoga sp.]